MGNDMAVNFKGDIEEIRSNFARVRTAEPYSKPIVAAEVNAHNVEYQTAVANLAGSERMVNSSTYIAGASNRSTLLDIVLDFNRMFSIANAPSKEGHSR